MRVGTVTWPATSTVATGADLNAAATSGNNTGSASRAGTNDASTSNSSVTLSAAALAIAAVAAKGITVQQGVLRPGVSLQEQLSDLPHLPVGATDQYDGYTSREDFESAVATLGATSQAITSLFNNIDTSKDGRISSDELLQAFANTANTDQGGGSQALLALMDTNADHTVSFAEFANFESVLIATQKPSGS